MTRPNALDGPCVYRDRDGKVIDVLTWGSLWEDLDYRVVAATQVGDVSIRTLWHGLAYEPLFITGIRDVDRSWITADEADTLADARANHERIVRREQRFQNGTAT